MGLVDEDVVDKVTFSVQTEGASGEYGERLAALTQERCLGVECIFRCLRLEVECA